MTEEENKAIEYFKDDINYLEEELKRPNFLGRFITIRDKECKMLKILLNLIEKLQKENEELKEKDDNNNAYKDLQEDLTSLLKKEFIPKDKIREIIEKLENEEKALRKDFEKHRVQLFELYKKVVLIEGYKKLLEEE